MKKGYKQTEVGEVPEEWEISVVNKCAEILDSKRIPLNQVERNNKKGNIPYYGANGILDYVDDFIFNEPLVLMAEDGGHFKDYFKKPICQKIDGKSWVNNHAHVLKAIKNKIITNWLFYWFVHRDILPFLNGGTRAKLNQSDLKKLPVALPPLPEQKKIAQILTSIDETIESTRKVIDQTKKVKQGLLQELLTKGIGHTKFKKVKLGFEEVEIPEEWRLIRIKEVVNKQPNAITAGPFGTIFKAKDFREKGIPIIQIRHITEDGFNWGKKITFMDEDVYQKLHVPFTVFPNDLLITKMGDPPGLSCLYPENYSKAMVTPDVIKASLDHNKINPYFAMYSYNCPSTNKRLLKLTKGGTRPRITLNEFYALKLPFPSLEEQNHIADILRSFDIKIELLNSELAQLQTLKKGLMQDLLTGAVRVKLQ
ncbi:restriction endonuclease subunit S [Desulfobacterales bacterium HSG17]|nr:restriction endonuclease subunit S [Desulfobacterales bacterium HSG17]